MAFSHVATGVQLRTAPRVALSSQRAVQGVARLRSVQVRAGASTKWPAAFEYLTDNKLKSVSATEAQKLMRRGYVLVDVRPDNVFDESRAAGSVNAPLFQPITGKSPMQLLRYALYRSMEVAPVEENPDFVEDAAAVIGKAKGVILACAEGGSLEASFPSFKTGKMSRSLVAAYQLLEAGVAPAKTTVHLQGGLNAWFRADLPGEGPEEWVFDARTPSEATAAPAVRQFSEQGRVADKSRDSVYTLTEARGTITSQPPSGTLLKSGGNALDPFGSWSVLLKKRKEEKEKKAAKAAK